jgi:hypothetical protein
VAEKRTDRGPKAGEIELYLDAPGLTRDSVDSAMLLRLGAAYLEMLLKIAGDQGRELEFHGMRVEPGSTRAFFMASDAEAAQDVADEAATYVSGEETPAAAGVEPLARTVSTVVRRMGATAKVIIGPWKRDIVPRSEVDRGFTTEIVSLRAEVLRVGGKIPAVRLTARGEEFPFTLRVANPSDTPKLGALIYQDVDIVATVRRDEDQKIVGGTLDEFYAIPPGSGVEAWGNWYRQACSEWDDVEDVNRELGRDDDDDEAGGPSDDRH